MSVPTVSNVSYTGKPCYSLLDLGGLGQCSGLPLCSKRAEEGPQSAPCGGGLLQKLSLNPTVLNHRALLCGRFNVDSGREQSSLPGKRKVVV